MADKSSRPKRRKNPFKLYAILFFAFILGVILMADLNSDHPFFVHFMRIPYADKLGHLFLFGSLLLLLELALNGKKVLLKGIKIPLSILLLGSFILAEEISQIWIENRTFDWVDLLFDAMGLYIAYFIARKILANRKSTKIN